MSNSPIIWPYVTILVVTYDRLSEISQTLTALHERLMYPVDRLSYLIADDCSPGSYRNQILDFWKQSRFETSVTFLSTSHNAGWGANVNNALRKANQSPIFFTEDDYVLEKPLDLRFGMALLMKDTRLGMVRYRATAGMDCLYHQQEVNIHDLIPQYESKMGAVGKLTYFTLSPKSVSLYVYSHGPHLKMPGFHQYYGEYPEGLKLGETEEAYAHHVKDLLGRSDAPQICILPDFVEMQFNHIGKSYQLTDKDRRRK